VPPFIFKITFKITTQAEHKLFVLPVYQIFLFMPSNFTYALSSNIGLWLSQTLLYSFTPSHTLFFSLTHHHTHTHESAEKSDKSSWQRQSKQQVQISFFNFFVFSWGIDKSRFVEVKILKYRFRHHFFPGMTLMNVMLYSMKTKSDCCDSFGQQKWHFLFLLRFKSLTYLLLFEKSLLVILKVNTLLKYHSKEAFLQF